MHARLSSLLIALAVGLSGCVKDSVPVEFFGFCGWSEDAANCKAPAGSCETYQNGQLYLYYQGQPELFMVAEFHNQRPDNSDVVPGGVNTANARITHFEYKFATSPPVALSAQTQTYLSTPIPSSGTATVIVPIIPAATSAELDAAAYDGYLEVEITPVGEFGDYSTFRVAPFVAPVWVYTGLPPGLACADPAQVPSYCPSPYQTHTVKCQ